MEEALWGVSYEVLGPFIAGLGLGLFYFAGLWLTVSRLTQTRNAALLFTASFAGRMAVLLAGIYLIADGRWQRIVICLVGILLMRFVLTRLLAPRIVSATPVRH